MKFLSVFLLCALAFLPNAAASQERFSVAFVNPGDETSFWGMVSQTMAAAAEDLAIDLEVVDTKRDRIAMLAAAEELASRDRKPDYAVIVNELEQGEAMAKMLTDASIPVFFLLNRLNDAQVAALEAPDGAVLGSVTPNNEIAGYEMAMSLVAEAKRQFGEDAPVKILAILGDAVTPAALAREAGLRRALAEAPSARLERAFPVLWDKDEAYRRSEFAMRVLDVNAVWAANDDLAAAAQQAAREHGLRPGEDMLFAGLNWSPHGLSSVKAGDMTMTHGGHFFGGAWAMVLLRDIHDGAATPDDVEFDMSAVTSANVDVFMERFGDRDWRKIDFKRFSKAARDGGPYDFSADAILEAAASDRR